MARFHFEIIDGVTIEDPVGMECKSEEQARQVAADIARQIAIDIQDNGVRHVSVKTDDGYEIHKEPVRPHA